MASLDASLELIKESNLCRIDLASRGRDVEELRPIDLRKARAASRPRRPFDLERVAPDGGRIAVPLDAPAVHDLAPLLLDRRERDKRPGRRETEFLLELAPGGGQQVFAVGR